MQMLCGSQGFSTVSLAHTTAISAEQKSTRDHWRKGLIPRALFLGEMRIISPVSFELRLLE